MYSRPLVQPEVLMTLVHLPLLERSRLVSRNVLVGKGWVRLGVLTKKYLIMAVDN